MIFRSFLSAKEVAQLVQLWRRTPGFDASTSRRGYHFHGCSAPLDLSLRVLDVLPAPPEAEYLDSFFLHYRAGQSCDAHVDARSLSRLNVLLVKPVAGGVFRVDGVERPMDVGDAILFHPSRQMHGVSKVEEGERLIWGMGLSPVPNEVVQARNRMPTPG